MKIKEGFILREVAGDVVVLPSGDLEINAMITLNETAAFLWKAMEKDITREELIAASVKEYKVDEKTAAEAIDGFVEQLKANDFLAE